MSETTHDKEYRIHKISSEKALNKERTTTNCNKNKSWGRILFPEWSHYIFKIYASQQIIMRHAMK